MTSTISVSLTSSFERDGRAFACPGELVTFFCDVNGSASVQIAVQPYICLADPIIYLANDPVGRIRPIDANAFQANLTNVQRLLNTLFANYRTTLTTIMTDETDNTTVQCSDVLTSSNIQRRNLIQSSKNKCIV